MTFRKAFVLFLIAAGASATLAGHDCDFGYSRVLSETRELRFDPSMNHQEIVVDNLHGSIHVEGYDGDAVILEVERSISARSEHRLDVAQKEVWLDAREDGDAILVYVEGPFRNGQGSLNYRGCRYYGYKNRFAIKLSIPASTEIYLRNVNGGGIEVEGVSGKFDVKNVNGPIQMDSISGSGRAFAHNGNIALSFLESPSAESRFGSHNGNIEAAFPADLSADLFFKTRNGRIYTDFEVIGLPLEPRGSDASGSKRKGDGMKIYKTRNSSGARVGKGGPRYDFDTFNGNIFIKKWDETHK